MSVTTLSVSTMSDESIVEAYRTAPDAKAKAAVRKAVKEAATTALMVNKDVDAAIRFTGLLESLVTKAPVTRPDYEGRLATVLATARAAVSAIESGELTVPEGVILDMGDVFARAIKADVDTDLFATLTTVKVRKSNTGDVSAYIVAAMADVPVGTFRKVSEIRRFRGGDYADEAPSAGAVSAALKSCLAGKREIPGIEALDTGVLGAVRTA